MARPVAPVAPAPAANNANEEPQIIYGDSTPFPYPSDFMALLAAVVDCCASMLAAQAGIDVAIDQLGHLEERLAEERRQIEALVDTVARAAARFQLAPVRAGGTSRAAAAAVELAQSARALATRECAGLEQEWNGEQSGIGHCLDDASTVAYRALEKLLLAYILPESTVAWQLAGDESGYDALVHVATPFGLQADFSASIPDGHTFARPRRTGELSPGTEARLPRVGEWRRADTPRPVRLDRLFLSEATLEPERMILVLRRNMTSGPGWRFVISGDDDAVTAQELADAAHPAGQIEKLGGDDRAAILRLGDVVLDATLDLPLRRHLMLDARLDKQTLRQRHEPREVCARILGALGPVVREIDRRSGAPGELVLRRHIGNGRREAVFIKKAELMAKVMLLPPSLAKLFTPLGLLPHSR